MLNISLEEVPDNVDGPQLVNLLINLSKCLKPSLVEDIPMFERLIVLFCVKMKEKQLTNKITILFASIFSYFLLNNENCFLARDPQCLVFCLE
jgi:hypothetical protein